VASFLTPLGICVNIQSRADGTNSDGDDGDGDGYGTENTSSGRLAMSRSMSKHQPTYAFHRPKLPQTESSSGREISLEPLLRLKLGSLMRSSEAASEAASQAASQVDSQSLLQRGSHGGLDTAIHEALNRCHHQRSHRHSRLAQVC
jgi:hypothetical protein